MCVLIFLTFISCIALCVSCQDKLETMGLSGDTDSAGSQLIRTVSFNAQNDSFVTNYEYNARGHLIKMWNNNSSLAASTRYIRDEKGRVVRIESTIDGALNLATDVYYKNENSGRLLYAVFFKMDTHVKT